MKETARLASTDSTFAQELKKVQAENAHIPQSGSVTIDNRASNYGPQGVFYGSISFNHHITKDTHSE